MNHYENLILNQIIDILLNEIKKKLNLYSIIYLLQNKNFLNILIF